VKKVLSVTIIAIVSACSLFAAELRFGSGFQFKPINRDLFSADAISDKDSWNFQIHSQYNWKNVGILTDFTVDYIGPGYTHFTMDTGFAGRFHYKGATFSLGTSFPITINNGQFGLDDIAFSSIKSILDVDRPLLLLWNTKLFLGFDYAITDKISACYRYSFVFGQAASSGTWASEKIKKIETGIVELFFTYRVL